MNDKLISYVLDWVTSNEDNSHLSVVLQIAVVAPLAAGTFVILTV